MIKVGYLISFDFDLLFTSIERIYKHVDAIYLAIDQNRKTWTGNTFTIDISFFEKIKKIDSHHKIEIYEAEFYIDGYSPMELETRERQMLSNYMGEGGWQIQIDPDEYCINFDIFSDFLKKNAFLLNKNAPPINVTTKLITLFKQNDKGYFVINPFEETVPIAFNKPQYKFARHSEGDYVVVDWRIIHQSWARSREEIQMKVKNWGHNRDFDVYEFFEHWDKLNENNYKEYIDFHPIYKGVWKSLSFVPAKNIQELIDHYEHTINLSEIKTQRNLVKMKRKLWFKRLLSYVTFK